MPLPFPIRALGALVFLVAAPPVQAQLCADPPADVVAWWTGDGSTLDIASGLDAKLVGGAGFAPGLVGDAFSLDPLAGQPDQRVLLSRLAADGLADFSVELWVNTTTGGGILSAANGDDATGNEVLLYATPANLTSVVKATGGAMAATVADGAWHHVAFVRSGASGATYVDGVLAAGSSHPTGSLAVGPHGLMLGQEQDCLGGCFDVDQALTGLVDELTIYGRALTGSEVVAVYDAGSAGKCRPLVVTPPDETAMRVDDLEMGVEDLNVAVDGLEFSVEDLVAQLGAALVRIEALEALAHEPGDDAGAGSGGGAKGCNGGNHAWHPGHNGWKWTPGRGWRRDQDR